jgi:hypothetical protein
MSVLHGGDVFYARALEAVRTRLLAAGAEPTLLRSPGD